MQPEIAKNAAVEPREIEDLREQVGWDRAEGTYAELLQRHNAYYTARDNAGRLIGYTSVLTDGIADGFLLDLMVHPDHRKSGLGTRLVQTAIRDLKEAGVRCVQVTFQDDLAPFYAQCGFQILKGGIIDFQNMDWREKR